MLSGRRAWFTSLLPCVAAAALALSSSGCISILGVQDTEVEFQIVPQKSGKFFGWTEITLEGADTGDANRATLVAVTLDVTKPEGTADLSFLQNVIGETVTETERTLVVEGSEFPRGEQAMPLKVVYDGDIRPLFKTPETIRIEWTGATNPAFTSWPADGFTVRARVKIDVE